jgi:Abnormal spindle-like microcephaly-assoc'd, ASPM-SPD-2-Hydin
VCELSCVSRGGSDCGKHFFWNDLRGGLRSSGRQAGIGGNPANRNDATFDNVQQCAGGREISQTVRFSNLNATSLRILKIAATTGEFTISGVPLPTVLEAGSSLTFTVSYKPKTEGNAAGRVYVTTSLDASPLSVEVKASAVKKEAELAASEASLDFDDIAMGSRSAKELVLTNAGNANVAISKVVVSGDEFSVSGGGAVTLNAGQTINLEVSFEPRSAGAKSGIVSVFSDAPESPLEIPLSGTSSAASQQFVALKWNAGENAPGGYFIYRSSQSGGPYSKLQNAALPSPEFTDTGLAAGHTYYYVVTSVDANNVESEYSDQIIVRVPEQ